MILLVLYDPSLKRWNKAFPFHTTASALLGRPDGDAAPGAASAGGRVAISGARPPGPVR